VRLHRAKNSLGRFAAAAHLAQSDDAVIGFDFDDRANESAPMAAVSVAERSSERNPDRSRTDIADPHLVSSYNKRSEATHLQGNSRPASSRCPRIRAAEIGYGADRATSSCRP